MRMRCTVVLKAAGGITYTFDIEVVWRKTGTIMTAHSPSGRRLNSQPHIFLFTFKTVQKITGTSFKIKSKWNRMEVELSSKLFYPPVHYWSPNHDLNIFFSETCRGCHSQMIYIVTSLGAANYTLPFDALITKIWLQDIKGTQRSIDFKWCMVGAHASILWGWIIEHVLLYIIFI